MTNTLRKYFAPGGPFFLIAGPCVLETKDLHDEIAGALWTVQHSTGIPVIFKASFDKANRSRRDAPRGPGLALGLTMLADVKYKHSLPVLTDIHEPSQARAVADVCDVLQVPAFLCRQTDLLLAAAATGRPVNVKKGQWVGVPEIREAVNKVTNRNHYPVAITERGTFFGYGDLVVDMRNIPLIQRQCRVPVIFDGTHSVQRPGRGTGGASGGTRDLIEPLVLAAVAAGANGLFLEVHPMPERAPSDSASMLPLERLLPLMRNVAALRSVLPCRT